METFRRFTTEAIVIKFSVHFSGPRKSNFIYFLVSGTDKYFVGDGPT
jgi:hypothetical protein